MTINAHTFGGLWFVTSPRASSTLADICFYASWARLRLNFLGGLDAAEIVGGFEREDDATAVARALLAKRDGESGTCDACGKPFPRGSFCSFCFPNVDPSEVRVACQNYAIGCGGPVFVRREPCLNGEAARACSCSGQETGAEHAPFCACYVDPSEIENDEADARAESAALDVGEEQIADAVREKLDPVAIVEHVAEGAADALAEQITDRMIRAFVESTDVDKLAGAAADKLADAFDAKLLALLIARLGK
jgi:hypothetical protein